MGRKLVLTGTKLTDLDAPTIPLDAILPQAGALGFISPVHEIESWPSGVPASGASLPNLAKEQAQSVGISDPTFKAGIGASWASDVSAGRALIERSGKGGLHWGRTSDAGVDSSASYKIQYSPSMLQYIKDNLTHSWYTALWGRTTRGCATVPYGSDVSQTAIDISIFYQRSDAVGDTQYPTTARRIGHMGVNTKSMLGKTNLPLFQDIAVASIATPDSTSAAGDVWKNSAGATGAPAVIFYGFYIEDLTVSGRTYQQVHDLVYAKYQSEVELPSGRYYNDTFTPIA